jgi:hypothetical protein
MAQGYVFDREPDIISGRLHTAFFSVSREKGQRNFVVNLSSGPTNSIHQSESKRSKGELVFVFYIFSVTNNDV